MGVSNLCAPFTLGTCLAVTSLTGSAGTATVTCTTSGGMNVGDTCFINYSSVASDNGFQTVSSILNATQWTFLTSTAGSRTGSMVFGDFFTAAGAAATGPNAATVIFQSNPNPTNGVPPIFPPNVFSVVPAGNVYLYSPGFSTGAPGYCLSGNAVNIASSGAGGYYSSKNALGGVNLVSGFADSTAAAIQATGGAFGMS